MNVFRITDGTTTINLKSGSPVLGVTYVPEAPSPQVARYASALLNGDVINAVARHNVAESATVVLEGTSASMETLRTSIQRMLWLAEGRQRTGTGAIVYVEYQETSASDTFRSELIGGAVEYSSVLARRARNDTEGTVDLLVNWERMWFWESTTETQPATRLKNVTPYTVGAKGIYNHDDALSSNGNYVEIAATGVTGDLPTPARIVLKNTGGGDRALTEYLFFNSWRATLTGTALFLQWESSSGAAQITDATCSSGKKMRDTANAVGTEHSFDVASIGAGADRLYFRPVVRFAAIAAGSQVWVKFKMISYLHGYAELGIETEERLLTAATDLQVFDAIPLRTAGNLAFAMRMRSEVSGTVDSDYLFLSPCDSIRSLRWVGLELVSLGTMVDFGDGRTQLLESDGVTEYGFVTPVGPPLMLMPGVAQRVYALASGDGSSPFWTFDFSLYYRKRVLVP